MFTLTAMYKKEHRRNKFMAMLQGVDLDEEKTGEGESKAVTFEEVKARAIEKITGSKEQANAARFGFNKSDGTGYQIVGLDGN